MAPGRRTSKPVQKTSSRNDGQNRSSVQDDTPRALSREDVTCKICLEILFKPVTLPCKHTMCYSCFENCVEKSNLTCPLCRKRIAVWARQSRKANTVVDEKLWADIRSQYPDLIKAFMEGKTADLDSEDGRLHEKFYYSLMMILKTSLFKFYQQLQCINLLNLVISGRSMKPSKKEFAKQKKKGEGEKS